MEEHDFVSMNYRTGFQNPNPYALKGISSLSLSHVRIERFCASPPFNVDQPFARIPLANHTTFRRFRTDRRTVSITGICSESRSESGARRRIHAGSNVPFVLAYLGQNSFPSAIFGMIRFNLLSRQCVF